MSAPTPAPGDDKPRAGYYPDPSIPGYVRYWNGSSWVPGTSRPAPANGESLAPPPGVVPSVEETGPHFFDEDPVEEQSGTAPAADSQHGSRPEPASAWTADRSRQSGFGGDRDQKVSWGTDPRVPHTPGPRKEPEQGAAGGAGTSASGASGTSGADAGGSARGTSDAAAAKSAGAAGSTGGAKGTTAAAGTAGAASSSEPQDSAAGGSTFVFRKPKPGSAAATDAGDDDPGTMTFRAVSPRRTGKTGAAASGGTSAAPTALSGPQQASAPSASATPGAASAVPPQAGGAAPQAAAGRTAPGAAGTAPQPGTAAPAPPAAPAAPAAPNPAVPPQAAAPGAAPLTSGPGGGQASWAQQVHGLAGGEEPPVVPWKPPVEDPFQAAARRQASARPAGLGKRFVARLLDTLVVGALTSVAAVPLGIKAVDHINAKIEAAKLSGETVTVWLIDGTTSVHLGIVLAVLLVAGVLTEVLPTVKWGRTLGKKLLGLEVRDIEAHETPEFGAALRRWLVYCVPGLLVVGVIGVLWCLFDKPWRQCWHDKAAHTFVAG
ncbi:hypothetical protein GCM10009535_31820 [Streptomyces thermocarboxydovorans]|uniref:RDD family protein n=1 Tax=Streptomyces thermocarboxydovorans TaxID=59298 RepID=A0ABP3SPL4_9ACTN